MADIGPAFIGLHSARVGTGATASFALDASNDKMAFIVQMPKALTITTALFVTISGNGTPPAYFLTLQGVGTDGFPDGTDVGGGSPTKISFTPDNAAEVKEITLTNSYAATRGEFIAIVLEYDGDTADTINASNRMRPIYGSDTTNSRPGIPKGVTDTAGAGYVNPGQDAPPWGLSDGTTYVGKPYINNLSGEFFDSGQEAGLRFKLPAGMGDTFQVLGGYFNVTGIATGLTIYFSLYTGTTLLQSIAVDSDFSNRLTGAGINYEVSFDEATLSTLTFDTEYFLVMSHSTTTNTTVKTMVLPSVAAMSALPFGAEWYSAIRTETAPPGSGGNAFSTTTTERPYIFPIINDLTEPAGGGGGGVKMAGSSGGLVG